ncbi:MAG TPA: glycosyltransferase family 2 protein [Acidimicrobiia bacterium]|jgi:cellulose synthase (UDP-forming)
MIDRCGPGHDLRLDRVRWQPATDRRVVRRVRLLVAANVALAVWYFGWLVRPDRIGNPVLFALLMLAEVFNLVQAVGFWWTVSRGQPRLDVEPWADTDVAVDVLIPVYNEPLDVVELTIAAAARLPGARVRVAVLDDGKRATLAAIAERYGARYLRRGVNTGAKAGNLNHALARTDAEFVVVLDCDHVPGPRLLAATLPHFCDARVAFVQAPQYYANADATPVAAAAWAQQSLFFGPIACGKGRMGAMFCCGTNVVFRRSALDAVGGFPEDSITEDFELSARLHAAGWRSEYVPEVVARGLGPEDMASYVSQQQRWAKGCLSTIPRLLRSNLPWKLRVQYLLSASYFLTGWTILVYMALPVVRILTGAQPLAGASADQFLVHFAPYFATALLTVATVGGGGYTYAAFCLATASFWIHVQATLTSVFRRRQRFVVTPKRGSDRRQPRAVLPALFAMAVLFLAVVVGLARAWTPAMLNNVSFAALHLIVLGTGVAPAFRRRARVAVAEADADADAREAA